MKLGIALNEGTRLQVRMALDQAGLKGEWKNNKVYVKKTDVKKAEEALKGKVWYRGKTPPGPVVAEGIDIKKASMKAVIKDFQDSDAPQFKGKSAKKRRKMAIAAKLST